MGPWEQSQNLPFSGRLSLHACPPSETPEMGVTGWCLHPGEKWHQGTRGTGPWEKQDRHLTNGHRALLEAAPMPKGWLL